MKLCNRECVAMCDFCKFYDFNGEARNGILVYVYKGWCNKRKEQSDPEERCNDFECINRELLRRILKFIRDWLEGWYDVNARENE